MMEEGEAPFVEVARVGSVSCVVDSVSPFA